MTAAKMVAAMTTNCQADDSNPIASPRSNNVAAPVLEPKQTRRGQELPSQAAVAAPQVRLLPQGVEIVGAQFLETANRLGGKGVMQRGQGAIVAERHAPVGVRAAARQAGQLLQ